MSLHVGQKLIRL